MGGEKDRRKNSESRKEKKEEKTRNEHRTFNIQSAAGGPMAEIKEILNKEKVDYQRTG